MIKNILKISFILLCLMALSSNAAILNIEFEITGIRGEALNSVVKKLNSESKSVNKTSREEINRFCLEDAPKDIKRILKTYGYFNSKVKTFRPTYVNYFWTGYFKIEPGPPLIITDIELKILGQGSGDRSINYNLRKFPLKKGEIFQVEKYNTAKQFLFDLTDEFGYITSSFESKEIQIDANNNTAKIILHFNTGPKYYFGRTIFKSQTLSNEFLSRFLPYKKNEKYSNKKVHSLREALNNSNFFQKVLVKPRLDKAKNNNYKVPIDVNLTQKKRRMYSFGAGFGTDMGIRGSIEHEVRYLTDTGQSFKGILQGSQVQNNLELHYLIPGKNPSTDLYNISAAAETIDIKKGKSHNIQLGVGYRTAIKGWQQSIKLNLQHERYRLTGQPYQTSTLLLPSLSLMHVEKDHMVKPTKGHRVSLMLQGTTKYISSSSDFLQFELDAKYLYTFPSQTQIILHGTFGYTFIDELNDLPLSLQFYTGGTQSIRGFGYQTIGPGRNLAVASIELRQKIYGDWYLATFFDAGNTSDDLLKKPKQGAGVGIVWRTSIGTLELTYAKAISQPGTPSRIQFSMGPEL